MHVQPTAIGSNGSRNKCINKKTKVLKYTDVLIGKCHMWRPQIWEDFSIVTGVAKLCRIAHTSNNRDIYTVHKYFPYETPTPFELGSPSTFHSDTQIFDLGTTHIFGRKTIRRPHSHFQKFPCSELHVISSSINRAAQTAYDHLSVLHPEASIVT